MKVRVRVLTDFYDDEDYKFKDKEFEAEDCGVAPYRYEVFVPDYPNYPPDADDTFGWPFEASEVEVVTDERCD